MLITSQREPALQQLSIFDEIDNNPPLAPTEAIKTAALHLLPLLEKQKRLHSQTLQTVMTQIWGGNDAQGVWQWKQAYEALEMAQILWVQKWHPLLQSLPQHQTLKKLQQLSDNCSPVAKPSHLSQIPKRMNFKESRKNNFLV